LEILHKYFPELSLRQLQCFGRLKELYSSWNEKINIVSRKDIDHLYERHVLHSLAIAKFISFKESTTVMDVGTGGGFPGIPLAIMFPKVHFHLVDSIGKKIKVVHAIISDLELDNASAQQVRAEELTGSFDFIDFPCGCTHGYYFSLD
jgi:16S rRNA (guanine527-N7)-methyltransferase